MPKAKDEERYIDGSPRVALKISPPFRSYIFIEKEDWRVDKLKELQDEFPNFRTHDITNEFRCLYPVSN
jgi:hypothetical protein